MTHTGWYAKKPNQTKPKEHERKLKTWMGNSTGNADKKSTSKNEKIEEKRLNMLGWKEKSNTSKTNNTTRGNKSEDTDWVVCSLGKHRFLFLTNFTPA